MKLFIFSLAIISLIFNVSAQLKYTFVRRVANGTCGQSTGGPIVQRATTRISYAGGFFWSDFGVKLCYIDRYGPAMGRYTPEDGQFNHMQINQGFESVSISPVKNGRSNGLLFVVGIDNRLILSRVTGSGNNLSTNERKLFTISTRPERFTRGRCDNKGRLWMATAGIGVHGNLYKIENLGTPEVMDVNVVSGGGMAWSSDYKYMYLVDSGVGFIFKYNFDAENGTLTNRKIIFRLEDQPDLIGVPFDLAIDTDGYLWISMLQGGSVIQYDETTESVLFTIAVPAQDVVSVAFGELDKKTLYVGTARNQQDTESGSIYAILGLGATGIIDNEIVIPASYLNS